MEDGVAEPFHFLLDEFQTIFQYPHEMNENQGNGLVGRLQKSPTPCETQVHDQ